MEQGPEMGPLEAQVNGVNKPQLSHTAELMKIAILIFMCLVFLSTVIVIFFFIWSGDRSQGKNKELLTPSVPVENTLPVQATVTSQTQKSKTSYSYLFQNSREADTSNIVGYFGSGAFGWYVPDWLPTNWTQLKTAPGSEDLVFAPNIRENSTDFSNITIIVKFSEEAYNAGTLYETEISQTDRSSLIINEVLLNKHEDDNLKIFMDTDTRIYHVEKMISGTIRDTYYIDGKGKTVMITFEARSDIFPQFAEKIRDMVEGMGELKEPQG